MTVNEIVNLLKEILEVLDAIYHATIRKENGKENENDD